MRVLRQVTKPLEVGISAVYIWICTGSLGIRAQHWLALPLERAEEHAQLLECDLSFLSSLYPL